MRKIATLQYKVFAKNEDLVEWQKNNKNIKIFSILPMPYECNFEIFVTYTNTPDLDELKYGYQ